MKDNVVDIGKGKKTSGLMSWNDLKNGRDKDGISSPADHDRFMEDNYGDGFWICSPNLKRDEDTEIVIYFKERKHAELFSQFRNSVKPKLWNTWVLEKNEEAKKKQCVLGIHITEHADLLSLIFCITEETDKLSTRRERAALFPVVYIGFQQEIDEGAV